jgi:heme-degrading monooxygenase HmoA
MPVYSIWDFHYPSDNSERGLAVAEAIWADMRSFEGYLGHELVRGLDDPGHIMVVSRWRSRDCADAALVEYAGNPNAQEANHLVDRPRDRFVGEVPATSGIS